MSMDAFLGAASRTAESVIFTEVADRSALLDLEKEQFYGLDDVGTRMWQELEKGPTIGAAAERLAGIYDAPLDRIQRDLTELVAKLRDHGLIEIVR